MNMKILKIIFICFLSMTLSACFKKTMTIEDICAKDPNLCLSFNKVKNCSSLRSSVIYSIFDYKNDPNVLHTISLLDDLDDFEGCLSSTFLVEVRDNLTRKPLIMANYSVAKKMTAKLIEEYKRTDDPRLAFYLWTKFKNRDALQVFLDAGELNKIKDPDLLLHLGEYYSATDPERSNKFIYRALRKCNCGKDLPYKSFSLLVFNLFELGDYKNAYIWAMVNEMHPKGRRQHIDLNIIIRKGTTHGTDKLTNLDNLEDIASKYYEELQDGEFKEYYNSQY